MKRLIIFLLFLLAAAFVFPDTQVSISTSASLATIGDRINLKILAKTSDALQEIRISTDQKDFEVIEEKDVQKRKEKEYTVFEKNITLTFFKIGDFDIEPFTIDLLKDGKVIETKKTNSLPISVKSVLKEEDKDIKPLKDLVELKGNPFYVLKYVIIILVIVLVVVLIILWIKKRARNRQIAAQPLQPPVEELEAAIKQLWEQNLFEKGKIKFFFIRLTKIMKRFLYRKYGFNAEDSTTYETVYFLKNKEQDTRILDNMGHIFDISDLVKFAKYIPGANVPVDILARIQEMVAEYKKREAPQPPLRNDATLRK
jgi:hypothetical protein